MYIRKTRKNVKGKTYTNYLLVEAIATAKGPRQRTVCSLGDLSARPAGEWLILARKLEESLAGQGDLLAQGADPEVEGIVAKVRAQKDKGPATRKEKSDGDLACIHTDRVEVEQGREAGPVHVGCEFWKRLGVDEVLRQAGLREKARLLTLAMVLNRLIFPSSENAMPEWIRSTALADIVGEDFSCLGNQALYRNMDLLHERRETIEQGLVERQRQLFALDTTVYLYDLTSTYFEGQALLNAKAKRGYSRDKRPDCKQLVVGLVVNREGFPLTHEVFEGNTRDSSTVAGMLEILSRRCPLSPGATVVVDRGMASDENRRQIRQRGYHYIAALRQSERDEYLETFEDLEKFQEVSREVSPNNAFQKKPRVLVKAEPAGEVLRILCQSQGRQEKDRAIRQKQEARFLEDVGRLHKSVANGRLKEKEKIHQRIGRLLERYPRVARYYKLSHDEAQHSVACVRQEEKREKANALDGAYIMETSRAELAQAPEEVWQIYSLLTRAESAFRAMKSPLAERPIWHHLEHRAETHIFLCVLAYHLLVAIEKTLRDSGLWTSWASVRQSLRNHQICTIVLPMRDGRVLRIRRGAKPDPAVADLYDRLGVAHRIIAPVKTWSEEGSAHSD